MFLGLSGPQAKHERKWAKNSSRNQGVKDGFQLHSNSPSHVHVKYSEYYRMLEFGPWIYSLFYVLFLWYLKFLGTHWLCLFKHAYYMQPLVNASLALSEAFKSALGLFIAMNCFQSQMKRNQLTKLSFLWNLHLMYGIFPDEWERFVLLVISFHYCFQRTFLLLSSEVAFKLALETSNSETLSKGHVKQCLCHCCQNNGSFWCRLVTWWAHQSCPKGCA